MGNIYKKVLFDLDNTLVDDDENRKYAFKQVLLDRNEIPTKYELERFLKKDDQYWKDRAQGKIKDPYEFKNNEEKTRWVRAERFIRFFNDISFEEAVEINNKYIYYLGKHIVPIKNAQEILKYLYEKKYEIYIVTNSPETVVNNKLEKVDAQRYIKGIFTAEEAGHMKPHDVFFLKFFQKIGTSKTDNMIIIGDELEKDILGGIKNDIDSCWLNIKMSKNETTIKPTYEITDLIELKNIL